MALSENYRSETIGQSDCRPIVRLSADTIVQWDYRPNPILIGCLYSNTKNNYLTADRRRSSRHLV